MAKTASRTRAPIEKSLKTAQDNARQLGTVLAHQHGKTAAVAGSDGQYEQLLAAAGSAIGNIPRIEGHAGPMLAAGARLAALRAATPYGNWLEVLSALGVESSRAQRMMASAERFTDPAFQDMLPSSLFELLRLTDAELALLAAGYVVRLAGNTYCLDDFKKMAVRELRGVLDSYLHEGPAATADDAAPASDQAAKVPFALALTEEEEEAIYDARCMLKVLENLTGDHGGRDLMIHAESFSVMMEVIRKKLPLDAHVIPQQVREFWQAHA